jgi:hypothetical protein
MDAARVRPAAASRSAFWQEASLSHVTIGSMMRGQVVLVAALAATALVGTAQAARTGGTAVARTCRPGQVSTKAHPCATAKSSPTTTTTPANLGPPVPVADPNPATGVPNPDAADQGIRVCGCDADTIMRYLDPQAGTYELMIYNTSAVGYINSVNWLPPAGLTVTAITATSGGTCKLDLGDISCTANGAGLAPPKCTCETGGVMTVDFTATGDEPVFNGSWWIYHGLVGSYMQITSMTPVPYYIPSYIPKPGI